MEGKKIEIKRHDREIRNKDGEEVEMSRMFEDGGDRVGVSMRGNKLTSVLDDYH